MADSYVRVRGTNTDQLEPDRDPRAEDPWVDLWFYSNPIFLGHSWQGVGMVVRDGTVVMRHSSIY